MVQTPDETFDYVVKLFDEANVSLMIFRLEDREDKGSFRILTMNKTAEKITRIDAKDYVGRNLYEAFPDLRSTDVYDKYYTSLLSRQSFKIGQFEYEDQNIEKGTFELVTFPLTSDVLGLAFHNISDIISVKRDLASRLHELEKLYKLNSERERVIQELKKMIEQLEIE